MKSVVKILFMILCIPVVMIAVFSIYTFDHQHRFTKIKEGMELSDARGVLGNPDESTYYNGEIMDVYYYFPLAEARFFYSKKDSTLSRSWRTDCD